MTQEQTNITFTIHCAKLSEICLLIYSFTCTKMLQTFVLFGIQILTAHEGNGGKLLFRGETQPWPTIHRGP